MIAVDSMPIMCVADAVLVSAASILSRRPRSWVGDRLSVGACGALVCISRNANPDSPERLSLG